MAVNTCRKSSDSNTTATPNIHSLPFKSCKVLCNALSECLWFMVHLSLIMTEFICNTAANPLFFQWYTLHLVFYKCPMAADAEYAVFTPSNTVTTMPEDAIFYCIHIFARLQLKV
ncbi:hypothetical protein TNCT_558131 [Trichonephila clavata]|uniref:Uncharacterized protein n=1 Tax=Trichonephila clavata TaxID=2740835 RepID=A0A8X6LLJ3_TRICU|nr:hypothetical protein TNCT_558131 [Trichonephila clavata]